MTTAILSKIEDHLAHSVEDCAACTFAQPRLCPQHDTTLDRLLRVQIRLQDKEEAAH